MHTQASSLVQSLQMENALLELLP